MRYNDEYFFHAANLGKIFVAIAVKVCRICMIRVINSAYTFALQYLIQDKMITINPYLNFSGDTEKAMIFYKSIFGNEFNMIQRFKELPGGDKIPTTDQQKIMHMSLPIGNSHLLASDALESMGENLNVGNNFTLAVNTDSEKEADKIFNALSDGGLITMAMNKAFWGAYVGMLTDKFNIQWMISYDPNK